MHLFRIGIEHENQHQELLVYDLKHMLGENYQPVSQASPPKGAPQLTKWISFPEGVYEIGASDPKQDKTCFFHDNEGAKHKTYIHPFSIASQLVTVGEFLEFIEDGGYKNYRWWFSDGWNLIKQKQWEAPMYFEKQGGSWLIRDFQGVHKPVMNEPISHVSYYEASAYAAWKGLRLPTEMEWEVAATYSPTESSGKHAFPWKQTAIDASRANLVHNDLWNPTPAGTFPKGSTPEGIHQLIGDLWEWTSSDYVPYPGFVSHFHEYNDKWFVNQKVLRGGSWATPIEHIRSTYRNFYYPNERWMSSGIRLARTHLS